MVGFMDALAGLTRTLVTIVFLAAVLELLLPSSAARRLARVVVGLLLILTVLGPVGKLLRQQVWVPAVSWQDSGTVAVQGVTVWPGEKPSGETGMLAVELFRQALERRADELATQVAGVRSAESTAIVNSDEKSDRFGSLERLETLVKLQPENTGGSAKEVSSDRTASLIEPVHIQVGPVTTGGVPPPLSGSQVGEDASGATQAGQGRSAWANGVLADVRRTLSTGLGIPEDMIVVRLGP